MKTLLIASLYSVTVVLTSFGQTPPPPVTAPGNPAEAPPAAASPAAAAVSPVAAMSPVTTTASQKSTDSEQQYADKAMEQMRQAIQAGYKDLVHLKQDADLVPLHGRDDFKKLLAELEEKQ